MWTITPWESLTLKIVAFSLASVVWTRYVVARAPAGLQRLSLAIPVVAAYHYMPFLYKGEEEAISGAVAYGFLGWHGTFKVLALCCNRGPLMRSCFSLWQQCAVQLMPIYPTDESAGQGRLAEKSSSLLACAVRIPVKAVVLKFFLQLLKGTQYPSLFTVFQACALFAYVSMVLDMLVLTTRLVFGLHICPTFDQPWRAVSIAEFWSRRWNIATSHLLRQCVYEPVVDGTFIAPTTRAVGPRQPWRDAGVFAAFLVSGIMHEIFQYAMNRTMLGLMLIFFTAQAPLMLVERRLVRLAKQRGCLPSAWLRNIVSVAILTVIGHFTFFASLNRTGLVHKVTDLQLEGFSNLERTLLQVHAWAMSYVQRVHPA